MHRIANITVPKTELRIFLHPQALSVLDFAGVKYDLLQ